MAFEIEHKFLVTQSLKEILGSVGSKQTLQIEQCYLSNTGGWTMRVRQVSRRLANRRLVVDHYSTMKKKVSAATCVEIEHVIPRKVYEDIKGHCGPALMKTRYEFVHKGHLWQLDHFTQPILAGLVLAEIELEREDEVFMRPVWLGEDVTHDKQYKNAKLVKRLGGLT